MPRTDQRQFAHLHVHTEFSDLDGMTKVKDAVAAAVADGQPGVATTDHGNVAASWELAAEAKKAGIKAGLGIEAYLAIGSRFNPGTLSKKNGDSEKTASYMHLTVIARTHTGWRNLLVMHEASQHSRKGKYPLIDYDLLTEHGEGLIVLTGCLGGPVAGPLARGDEQGARDGLDALIAAVGKENVYVEVMEHGVEDEAGVAEQLADLAAEYGLDLVATNDSHYTHANHAHAHEAWLAIQTRSNLKEPRENRFHFQGEGYHLRTAEEMYALRDEAWWHQACANTVKVFERIDDDVLGVDGHLRLPKFPVDDDCTSDKQHLIHLVREGAKARYGDPYPVEVKERLTYELGIVAGMGMCSYFLIVADMIAWARSQGIATGPGRGSAAGSAISYCLGIVQVDPIRGGLLFERFLDPTRVGMPDIDSDFEQARRPEVLRYLTHKYGQEFVAQIGTLQVAASRGAVKRAQQALGHPAWIADKMTKAVPMDGAKPYPLARIRKERNEAGASFYSVIDEVGGAAREIANLATKFENVATGKSIHACGVVIGDEPLTDLVPLRREASFDEDTPSVTEWEAGGVEGAGLLKLDVLGLRNLDIVTAAVSNIKNLTGETVDLDNLPDGDDIDNPRVAAAYELYARGNTSGLFQMDCLSGDTFVSGRRLRDLYERFENGEGPERINSVLFDDGRFYRNRVISIQKMGVKELFRVRTDNGRYIDASATHRVMTKGRGWVEVSDLRIEDSVLVDPKAKRQVERFCADCQVQIGDAPGNTPTRCYKCSAGFHRNPRRSKDSIRDGVLRSYERGRDPWNKGLSAASDARLALVGQKTSAKNQGRSLVEKVGATRAAELNEAARQRMTGDGNHMFGKPSPHRKGGYRKDLGHYVRSTWEADLARVLNYLDVPYEYESRQFLVTLPDGTEANYTPDFYLPGDDTYIEVKGFMRDLDQQKIDAFVAAHPDVNFVLVDKAKFAEFQLQYKDLVEWECPQFPERSSWETVTSIESVGNHETYDIWMDEPAHNYIANGFVVHNSEGMTNLATKVRPTSLEDLSALLALYRPGPMSVGAHDAFARRKAGTEKVDYNYLTMNPAEVDVIDSVLGNTLAVLVYQEQVMQLAERIAGFDAGQKSTLRKAFSKKDMEKMMSLRDLFFDGGTSGNGPAGVKFARKTLESLWVAFEGSASYLFNKSHSYAYGYLSFVTAYLKANWPAPYGAAMLSVTKDAGRRGLMLASLKSDGISAQSPDVNTAGFKTAATAADTITLGLAEIRDVGATAKAIVAEREANGPFTSLADLAGRVRHDGKRLNSTVLSALVSSGACDSFGPRKAQARLVRIASEVPDIPPGTEEWGVVEKAVRAHKYIGVFVGDHPMKSLQSQLKTFRMDDAIVDPISGAEHVRLASQPVMRIREVHSSDRKVVRTLGMVTGAATKLLKNGLLASGTLEGQVGAIEFAAFRADKATASALSNGQVVAIKAKRGEREITETDEDGNETTTTVARLIVNDVQAVPYTDSGQIAESRPLALNMRLLGTLRPGQPTSTPPSGKPAPRVTTRTKPSTSPRAPASSASRESRPDPLPTADSEPPERAQPVTSAEKKANGAVGPGKGVGTTTTIRGVGFALRR